MNPAEALAARLPEQAHEIRRRYWRDADFREFCDDFDAATDVLDRLERVSPSNLERLVEYQGILAEMLDDAVRMLGR